MKMLQIWVKVLIVLFVITTCSPRKAAESVFHFNRIAYRYDMSGTINGWIKDDRIHGEFINAKLQKENLLNSLVYPFWDPGKESNFGGGWKMFFLFPDNNSINALFTTNVDPKAYLQNDDEYLILYFFFDNNTTPSSCKIGAEERCGFTVNFIPMDLEARVGYWATSGEAELNTFAPKKIGDHVKGKIHAINEEHFDLTLEFDATIKEIERD